MLALIGWVVRFAPGKALNPAAHSHRGYLKQPSRDPDGYRDDDLTAATAVNRRLPGNLVEKLCTQLCRNPQGICEQLPV